MLENIFICYYTWFLFTINCWMVWLRVVFVWMHIYLANLKTLSLHLSALNFVVDLSGYYHVLNSVIHTLFLFASIDCIALHPLLWNFIGICAETDISPVTGQRSSQAWNHSLQPPIYSPSATLISCVFYLFN